METGMDPELKKYFRKIINSFSLGFLWILCMSTAGLYFKLALISGNIQWYNIIFYLFLIASFAGLLWYYYKVWKD